MRMRMKITKKTFLILLGSLFLMIIFYNLRKGLQCSHKNELIKKNHYDLPIILWWNFMTFSDEVKQCEFYKCRFTYDRNVINFTETKGIIFYGSNMKLDDFPLPRSHNHIWALFHEESPKNLPYIQYENALKHFNYTATFSRYSDFPLTTQYLKDYETLRSKKYVVPIGEKSILRKKLASVVYLQSICDTMSGRDEYVSELMKYIKIDSYGNCLNNKNLTKSLTIDYHQTLSSDELYKLLANYKFIIAYENGICDDYITEKFWRPLIIGSIPIYFGSPTIQDWLPNKKSAILITDFESPKKLANFLINLDNDDIEYNSYLDHKYLQINPISNELLLNSLFNRNYEPENVFESYECFICKMIHELLNSKKKNKQFKTAKQRDYNCGDKLMYPKISAKMNLNKWNLIQNNGKCEANILNILLNKNVNYTTKDWENQLLIDFNNGNCKL